MDACHPDLIHNLEKSLVRKTAVRKKEYSRLTCRCSFCSQHKFWQGSYRQRDPDKFVAEIEHLFLKYGVNVFFVADEYPTNDKERWERILDILMKKQLGVHILIETCVQDI